MTDAQRRRAEELFQRAADLPADERPAFLAEHADPALRAEVEALLASLEDDSLLDTIATDDRAALVGTRVGPYTILELIGEGGFGSVFLAQQEEPIHRQVALKVIKLGMDTRQVIARFEVERQALALMDHPGIARVLDAGATDAGRPYFVMELVRGVPITHYCDEHNVRMRQRLELFVRVCHAVQHAHLKGIIHRDIKPSNVLVTVQDEAPIPKVIDFGIAKATDRHLTAATHLTEMRQLIGTPQYMSPEQAEMGGLDVDTRTDIYSLGVLLYVLLTGKTPLDGMTMQQASFEEIKRIIREDTPATPSRRVSRLGADLEEVARTRRVPPQNLSRLMRGDLDWIVMQALEKDRDRRYDTAAALAADVQHHLNHEPVKAGPPSAAYRIKKFVRRHRVGVVTTALVALAVVIGGAVATVGFLQATSARRSEAEQRGKAEASARAAQAEAVKAGAVKTFLQQMLEAANPGYAPSREISMRFILDEATRKIDSGVLAGQPEVEADVRSTLGKTYAILGVFDVAEAHLEAVVGLLARNRGEEAPPTLEARCWLGSVLLRRGRYARAETLLNEALETARRTLGDDDPRTALIMNHRATSLLRRGRYKEAESLYRTAVEIQRRLGGEEHSPTLETMAGLAASLVKQGQNAAAETLYKKILAIQRRVFGADDIQTLDTLISLGPVLLKQDKVAEAEQALRTAFKSKHRLLGDEHPDTLIAMHNLALALRARREYARSEALHRQALEIQRRILGDDHPDTATSITSLISLLRVMRKTDDIENLVKEIIAKQKEATERPDADAFTLNRYAWLLLTCEIERLRDPQAALPAARHAVEMTGSRNPALLDTLAVAYYRTGDLQRAIQTELKATALAPARGSPRLRQPERRLIAWLYEARGIWGVAYAHAHIVLGRRPLSPAK